MAVDTDRGQVSPWNPFSRKSARVRREEWTAGARFLFGLLVFCLLLLAVGLIGVALGG